MCVCVCDVSRLQSEGISAVQSTICDCFTFIFRVIKQHTLVEQCALTCMLTSTCTVLVLIQKKYTERDDANFKPIIKRRLENLTGEFLFLSLTNVKYGYTICYALDDMASYKL